MQRVELLNEVVVESKVAIKEAKQEIEISLKEIMNIVLDDVSNFRKLNELATKRQIVKLLKDKYSKEVELDSSVKTTFNKVCDYILLKLNINLEEVTVSQFNYLIGAFNKVNELPNTKSGEINKRYVKGLENVVNKNKLNDCKADEEYKEYIKEIKEYISSNKIEA